MFKDAYVVPTVVRDRVTSHIAVKLFHSVGVSAAGHAKQEGENTSEMRSASNDSNRQCS